MSEFVCRKHGYHDETETHSCPDCYADWLAAKPKAPPAEAKESPKPNYAPAFRQGIARAHAMEVFGPPDQFGWRAWKGDTDFRPAGLVEVVLVDGTSGIELAECWQWELLDCEGDIVKWRPAQ